MTSVKLKLNKDRIRRDGTYPLVFQLIHLRRKKLIYTPFKLHEDEFDEEHGKVLCVPNGLRPPREIRRMNREIARQRRSIDGHIETLESRRESYTVADVVFRYQVEHDSLSLLHYIDLQIKQRECSGRFGSVAAQHARIGGGLPRIENRCPGRCERYFRTRLRGMAAAPRRLSQYRMLLYA